MTNQVTSRQRRLKCDETLSICRRCETSGRVCKGLWAKTSTAPQAPASSNTSPAANTRAITANPEYDSPSAGIDPPISSPDPNNRQQPELILVESSIAKTGRERTSVERGRSPAIDVSGRGEDYAEDFISVEAPGAQRKEKKIQDLRQHSRPSGQGCDYRPSTLMVVIDHSESPAKMSEQTPSECEMAEGANVAWCDSTVANIEGFQKTPNIKVTNVPPNTRYAC